MENKYTFSIQKYFLIFSFIFSFINVNASHIPSGEITYFYLGNGNYQITCKIYRDCKGVPLCTCPGMTGCSLATNGTLTITGADPACVGSAMPGPPSMTIDVNSQVSGFDVIELCRTEKTLCTNCGTRTPGTYQTGIEVYTFVGILNLSSSSIPASCCNIVVGYSNCCRIPELTTMQTPSSQALFFYASINRCSTSPGSSSPLFNSQPTIVACSGQEFSYNIGAFDPEGDSLSYKLIAPLISYNTPAPLKVPYTASSPFPYLGAPNVNLPSPLGLHVNNVTGEIKFTPIGNFVSNFVIEITQWRYGAGGTPYSSGKSMRDILLYCVSNCEPNNAPKITTYDENGQLISATGIIANNIIPNNYEPMLNWKVCAQKPLCFYIEARDDTAYTDTTDLNWNAPATITNAANGTYSFSPSYSRDSYPNSSEHVGVIKYDHWKFCWTPSVSAYTPTKRPYYFSIKARDRMCPISARSTQTFSIVVNRTPEANITIDSSRCGFYRLKYALTANAAGVSIDHSYTKWNIETAPGSGKYITKPSDVNNIYKMSSAFAFAGKYKIYLSLRATPNDCPNDSILYIIDVPNQVKVIPPVVTNCFGKPVKVTSHGMYGLDGGNRFQYFKLIDSNYVTIRAFNRDSSATITPPLFANANNASYKVEIIEPIEGCKHSAFFDFTTYTAAQNKDTAIKISLLSNGSQCVYANSFNLQNNSIAAANYYWKFSDGSIANDIAAGIHKSFDKAGIYNVSLLALKDSVACLIDSNNITVTVNPKPNTNTDKIGTIYKCQNDSVLVSPSIVDNQNDYRWYYVNSSQTNTIYPLNQLSIYMNQTGKYYLWVQDKNTLCMDTSDEINFVGSSKVLSIITPSKVGTLCNNESVDLSGPSNTSYNWVFGGSVLSSNKIIHTNQAGVYTLITGSGICADTSTYTVSNSIVNISSNNNNLRNYNYCPNTPKITASILPIANAKLYSWHYKNSIIKSGLDNSVLFNADNNYNNKLKVIATNTYGCSDSMNITLTPLQMNKTSLSIIGDTDDCVGRIINISSPYVGDVKYYYQKNNAHLDSINYFINVSDSGRYRLVLKTISTGCIDTSRNIPIAYNNKPVVSIIGNDTVFICSGTSIKLSSKGTGNNYQWQYNSKYITGAKDSTYTASKSGLYSVVNSNGTCADVASVHLIELPKPTKPVITNNNDTLMVSSNAFQYVWLYNNNIIPTINSQQYAPLVSGLYKVIVSNNFGCTDSSDDYVFNKTSLSEIALQGIKIYPNPTNNYALLELAYMSNWQVNIHDVSGRIIRNYKTFKGKELIIQKDDLKTGVYLLYINSLDNDKQAVIKLMIE